MSDAPDLHRAAAAADPSLERLRTGVLTVSDTRTLDDDTSGGLAERLLVEAGHDVVERAIVRDEIPDIRDILMTWRDRAALDVIVTTGGTGLARRDVTADVVAGLLARPMEGFGELFRMVSFQEIGPASMLSRALAGVMEAADPKTPRTLIFALPGSTNAVRTAMTKLIVPELRHLVKHAR